MTDDFGSLKIRPIPFLEVTHIAVFRNLYGTITNQKLLFLPLASDEDANMSASSMRGALDVYCDVFEIHNSHRTGGWKFEEYQG